MSARNVAVSAALKPHLVLQQEEEGLGREPGLRLGEALDGIDGREEDQEAAERHGRSRAGPHRRRRRAVGGSTHGGVVVRSAHHGAVGGVDEVDARGRPAPGAGIRVQGTRSQHAAVAAALTAINQGRPIRS